MVIANTINCYDCVLSGSLACLQVLIATSTLAWGVNFPAHLVIIKGTEYYDGKTRRYVDFPITGRLLQFYSLTAVSLVGRCNFTLLHTAVLLFDSSVTGRSL